MQIEKILDIEAQNLRSNFHPLNPLNPPYQVVWGATGFHFHPLNPLNPPYQGDFKRECVSLKQFKSARHISYILPPSTLPCLPQCNWKPSSPVFHPSGPTFFHSLTMGFGPTELSVAYIVQFRRSDISLRDALAIPSPAEMWVYIWRADA